MKIRYIINTLVNSFSTISDFNLVTKKELNKLEQYFCIAVKIPTDIILTKSKSDNVYITDSIKPISEFEPIIYLKINGSWVKNSTLTRKFLLGYKFDAILHNHFLYGKYLDYVIINQKIGYGTKQQYKWYLRNIEKVWFLDKLPNCNGDEKNYIFPEIPKQTKDKLSIIRDYLETNKVPTEFLNQISDEMLYFEWHIFANYSYQPIDISENELLHFFEYFYHTHYSNSIHKWI